MATPSASSLDPLAISVDARTNFAKLLDFYLKVAASTLLTVFQWLYKYPLPIENVIDHISKKPFNQDQLKKLKNIKEGIGTMEDQLDISILFLLIKTTSKLADANYDVWNNNCPEERKGNLEHLLFIVKNERNDIAHNRPKFTTNQDVIIQCYILSQRLSKIIEKAGKKAKKDQSEIENIIRDTKKKMEKIRDGFEIYTPFRPAILEAVKEDFKYISFIDKDKKALIPFQYWCPNLRMKEFGSVIDISDLLNLKMYQVTIIEGIKGIGKTMLAEVLLQDWCLNGCKKFPSLLSYEIVFKINCCDIETNHFSSFLEKNLVQAMKMMQKMFMLENYIEDLKILWILDGFEEFQAPYINFFSTMIKKLSDNHRLIITTAPHCTNHIKQLLNSHKIRTMETVIEPLSCEQMEKMIDNTFNSNRTTHSYYKFYAKLDDEGRNILNVPACFIHFIELLINCPQLLNKYYDFLSFFSLSLQYIENDRVYSQINHYGPYVGKNNTYVNIEMIEGGGFKCERSGRCKASLEWSRHHKIRISIVFYLLLLTMVIILALSEYVYDV